MPTKKKLAKMSELSSEDKKALKQHVSNVNKILAKFSTEKLMIADEDIIKK